MLRTVLTQFASRNRSISALLGLLVLVLVSVSTAVALGKWTEQLEKADAYYGSGNFSEVVKLLIPCVEGRNASREEKVEAHRLLAMTYIAIDSTGKAVESVGRLLSLKPNFQERRGDPLLFTRLVEALRNVRGVTVVSASKVAEPLEEVPVPVTVITSQMIRSIGARTLKDVLITYVPGMTYVQDQNEINVAQRGVYGSSQQKMLIMLDGHRLNMRAYSAANPDFSISLEKVKQIEVLRGPASSLYGNVALTAVINIITKDSAELDGGQVFVEGGNYGQRRLSGIYSKRFPDGDDLLLWGATYQADGERVSIPGERDYSKDPTGNAHAILDGYKDRPSYDLGLKYAFRNRLGSFSLFANARYSKYIEPFSAGGTTGESYNYDEYESLNGAGPGLGTRFEHIGLTYDRGFSDDLSLQARVYHDRGQVQVNLITNPTVGGFGAVEWLDWDLGSIVQFQKEWNSGFRSKANLIVGAQIEKMWVYDSSFPRGSGGKWTGFPVLTRDNVEYPHNQVLAEGSEAVLSGFAQLKYSHSEHFVANLGMRVDRKSRFEDSNIQKYSPRLAVITTLSPTVTVKLSFAKSFVDVPYWYRHNKTSSFWAEDPIQPEDLQSWQMTPTFTSADRKTTVSLNAFYNKLNNFLFRDNASTAEKYTSDGNLQSWGLEGEAFREISNVRARANVTYQRVIDANQRFVRTGDKIDNVPSITANGVLDLRVAEISGRSFWLNLTGRYVGEQASPLFTDLTVLDSDEKSKFTVDAVFLVNAGAWVDNLPGGFSLDARIYNLFNKEYFQGGSVVHPYPQPSRWFAIKLGYKMR